MSQFGIVRGSAPACCKVASDGRGVNAHSHGPMATTTFKRMRRTVLLACFTSLAACASAPPPARVSPPVAAGAACSDTVRLVVATTTDVHGRLRGWDYELNRPDSLRGLTRAATIVDSVRSANPGRMLLIDAGDLLQGNMLAYVAARVAPDTINPIVASMNAMHYDASAIGNHEYNYGVPYLERAVTQAHFPFLSANTKRLDGTHPFVPYTLVVREGIRIAIVGATTPGVMVWDRDNVANRLTLEDIIPAVQSAATAARAGGAQLIIVTVHSGLDEPSSYDTIATKLPSENVAARVAREVPGVALVLYGHSHKQNAGSDIATTRLLQAKNWAQSVGVATLPVVKCGDSATVVAGSVRSALIPVVRHAESPALLAITQPWHDRTVQYVTAPVGTTPVAWRGDSARVRDTPVVDFVLEVMRKVAKTDLAAGSAFGFAGLDSGAISIADLARIYPYDNTLRAVRISGAQLRGYLEQSAKFYGTFGDSTKTVTDSTIPGYNFDIIAGADYTLDISKPVGSRVAALKFHGTEVQPTDSFTLALNNYRQTGGGGYSMIAGAPVIFQSTDEIRVLLEREVRSKGVIRPGDYFTPNWRLVPGAAAARAYNASHRGDRRASNVPMQPPPTGPHLRIISTNDFHGALEPRPDSSGKMRGGAAYVATAIARAVAECRAPACVPLILDGGDEWQGTPASNLAYGRPGVRIFEHIGLAASALGNHEFDWSQDTLRARMREANYRILGANVRDTLGRHLSWLRGDTIVRRGQFRVGIIGLATTATPQTTRAINVADLRFIDPAPVVDSLTRVLRKRGANVIVVIAHAGASCDSTGAGSCKGEIIDLANNLSSPVDAIVSGHTHTLVDAVVNGMPIVQARSRGQAIAVADIYPARLGAADTATAHVRSVYSDTIAPDPVVAAIVARAVANVGARMSAPVGVIAATYLRKGSQYPLGNLIADSQRWSAKSDVAVMNNGGIRADLRAGAATYGALFEVQPFGNMIFRYTVTGAALRGYMEALLDRDKPNAHVSGLTIRYDHTKPAGQRIVAMTLASGQAVRDDGRYTLAMNDFMVTGGDGLALQGKAIKLEDLKSVDVDALAAYLKTLPQPVVAPADPRLIDVAER